jgi:1,4-alpha-glucan branching enzyme
MARQDQIFKNQTFHLEAPTATKVLLVGDFTHWREKAIPMQKGNDGVWTVTVKLSLGTYNYLFIVDGEWRDDPECPLRVANPYGSQNMVLRVT